MVIFVLQEMLSNETMQSNGEFLLSFKMFITLQNQMFHSNRNANLNLKLNYEVCAPFFKDIYTDLEMKWLLLIFFKHLFVYKGLVI